MEKNAEVIVRSLVKCAMNKKADAKEWVEAIKYMSDYPVRTIARTVGMGNQMEKSLNAGVRTAERGGILNRFAGTQLAGRRVPPRYRFGRSVNKLLEKFHPAGTKHIGAMVPIEQPVKKPLTNLYPAGTKHIGAMVPRKVQR